jgi:hypothetical protein
MDTVNPDFTSRFMLGVWRELIESAVVSWEPDRTVNLVGSGFDGTEVAYLRGEPEEYILDFLRYAVGELYSLARRMGSRAPTPAQLGRDFVGCR